MLLRNIPAKDTEIYSGTIYEHMKFWLATIQYYIPILILLNLFNMVQSDWVKRTKTT